MSSNTEIANMAIGHLGVKREIANLDTENSAEANICRRFFDTAMNSFQREFPYAFDTKQATLGLITEDPNDSYKYEYTYPSDCQSASKIYSGRADDTRQSRVPFRIARGTSGRVIWTNCQDAILEYQVIEDEGGRYQCDVIMSFSFLLASLVAPTLTGGDPFKLGQNAERRYFLTKSDAQANSLNEQQPAEPAEAEWIREMNGETNSSAQQDWIAYPINYRVT